MRRLLLLFWIAVASAPASAGVQVTSFSVSSPPSGGGVFTNIGTAGSPRSNITAWPVTVDLATLSTLPSSLVVNFPDRASDTLTRMRSEPRGPGAFLWTGRGNSCTAMFSAAPFGFRGVISCPNANYGVDAAADGSLQLMRNTQSGATTAWEPPPPSNQPPAAPSTLTCPQNPSPPDTAVEILVLYTEQVRLQLDGAIGTSNTVKFAHDAVDATQMAMDASTSPPGVPSVPPIAQVKFLAAKEVSRPDSGDITADLTWVVNVPEPIALRNYWSADVVMYLTEIGQPLGTSNEPSYHGLPPPGPNFAPLAAGAVVRSHAIFDDSGRYPQEPFLFLHEFGHVLAANHDRANANNNTPVEPWAFGHWANNPDGGNRTIMSYLVASQCSGGCPRIPYYSNSNVVVDWFRTGVLNDQENYRVITYVAPVTAQYCASLGRIFADGFE